MVMVTNKAKGVRGVNVGRHDGADDKRLKGTSTGQVFLAPGESRDLDLHDKEHPVFKAMIENGDLVLGEKSDTKTEKEQPRFNVENLNNDELKAFIKDRTGGAVEGNPSREALVTQARKLAV